MTKTIINNIINTGRFSKGCKQSNDLIAKRIATRQKNGWFKNPELHN